MDHHIVVIHGIGKAERGYSKPLREGILRATDALEKKDADNLIFHEIVWDDCVAVEQARLADVLRQGFGLAAAGAPLSLWKKIRGWPKRMVNALRTDVAAQYIEDILSYRDKTVYTMIHGRLDAVFQKIAGVNKPGRLSIVAHSLGTVIASDHIYDRQKKNETLAGIVPLCNFFTLGSPIALFALNYGGVELFKSPARLEEKGGSWLNIFDKDDPIGYPLKTLNDAYKEAVTEDVLVNTGIFGFAHVRYFSNRDVHNIIAREL